MYVHLQLTFQQSSSNVCNCSAIFSFLFSHLQSLTANRFLENEKFKVPAAAQGKSDRNKAGKNSTTKSQAK